MRGMPVGRQFASGSSLDCLDFMSFSASGNRGMVSPFPRPTARSCNGPQPRQTPDRSGFPSGRWGVGPLGVGLSRCCPPWDYACIEMNDAKKYNDDFMNIFYATDD